MRITKLVKTRSGKELVLRNYRERKGESSQPPVWTDNTILLPKK